MRGIVLERKEKVVAQAFLGKRDKPKNEGCLIFLIKLASLSRKMVIKMCGVAKMIKSIHNFLASFRLGLKFLLIILTKKFQKKDPKIINFYYFCKNKVIKKLNLRNHNMPIRLIK